MQAKQCPIKGVLTEQICYTIPAYQRPYSWEKENVEQMLDDMWEAYESGAVEYFIGSLITIEREKDARYEVVDGQQRLTTLNLIFARMRDSIRDERAKDALAQRILPRDNLTEKEDAPRLTLRQKDQKFFIKHVIEGKEVSNDDFRGLDAPKRRIAENMESIDKFIREKLDEKSLKEFATYILGNVYVVFVTTDSIQSAYRLFNVLNARGVSLSNADLIKNTFFTQAGESTADGEKLDEQWREIEDVIGIESLDQYFEHFRASIKAEKARENLHAEYEALIEMRETPLEFLGEIARAAQTYRKIQDNDLKDDAVKRPLASLLRVKFEDWIPPLLAFMEAPADGMAEAEFISLLEKITYQNWIRRISPADRLKFYYGIISAVKGKAPADDIRDRFRESARNEEFAGLVDGEVYGKPFAKAVLLKLEEAGQDESVVKEFKGRITIEHIMPQSRAHAYWRERFSDEEHEEWLHKIGNLALLDGIKNQKASNWDFARKKEAYGIRNRKVSFDTTKEILDLGDWNADELARRQERMAGKIKELWSIE